MSDCFPIFKDVGVSLSYQQRLAINNLFNLICDGSVRVEKVDKCFCGSTSFRLLSEFDRFGLPFGTHICKECGLISQTQKMAEKSLPIFYEKIYWPLINAGELYLTAEKSDEKIPYVLNHISTHLKSIKIFEIGCGSGSRITSLSNALKSKNINTEMYGCDYSEKALKLAEGKGVITLTGGMEQLAKYGVADVIILSHVFEHFSDLNVAMSYLRNLCSNETLIYIEVPGVLDLKNKSEYTFNYQYYCVLAHIHNFSLETLSMVLGKGGFTLIDGDEYVRAVFKMKESTTVFQNSYEPTIFAINEAYRKYKAKTDWKRNSIYIYLATIAKAVLARN